VALGAIGAPAAERAERPLARLLEDKEAPMRYAAAEALRRIGTPTAAAAFTAFAAAEIPRLAEHLSTRERPERGEAARSLIHLAPLTESAIPVLAKALADDPDWLARTKSAEALGALGPLAAPAIPDLAAALDDTHAYVRDASAAALKAIGTSEARKRLADFNAPPAPPARLPDEEPAVRLPE
jgi:HEAT repeat protein